MATNDSKNNSKDGLFSVCQALGMSPLCARVVSSPQPYKVGVSICISEMRLCAAERFA